MATETTENSTTAPALEAGDLCEAFARTVARWGDAPAMRSSDGQIALSWNEVDGIVRKVAGGLRELGIGGGGAGVSSEAGTVAMMLTNRYEAAVTDLATLHLGAVPLSVYNSASIGQLTYLFEDSGAQVVVTEKAFADRAREAIAATAGKPKLVVVDGDDDAAVSSFDELMGLGEPLAPGEKPDLAPNDLITVVYTSGTTGDPKGAELTQYNILEQIRGLASLGRLPDGGSAISYLPFAHMGDRLCAYYMPLIMGACITYHADPRTAATLLPELQPTLYMTVPRVWQAIQGFGLQYIDESEDKTALEEAIALGEKLHDDRVEGRPLDDDTKARWDAHDAALAKLRTHLGLEGGELLFTGAAPLPPETLRFFASIGVDLCECYGQSETAGIILCNPGDRPRPLTNGLPLPGVEAKLAEDGELLLKGPMVMRGYRNKPELTEAAFDEDGWLITGDIFEQDDAGYYRIVDRKKEIIVLSNGKNVSPVLVENTVTGSSPLIALTVCVGNERSYITALIGLEPESGADPDDPEVIEQVRAAIAEANQELGKAEQVKRFRINEKPWMPGTAELTPTMKLKRKEIDKTQAAAIAALYEEGGERCHSVT